MPSDIHVFRSGPPAEAPDAAGAELTAEGVAEETRRNAEMNQRGLVVDRRHQQRVASRESDPCGDFEKAAARVVARLTHGEAVLQDDGSKDAVVDIALTYPDGRPAVVEVWTASDQDHAAMQRHLRSPPPQDSTKPFVRYPRQLPVPELGRLWNLSVSARAKLKPLMESGSRERQELEQTLIRLEGDGDTFETFAVLAELPPGERAKVADLEALEIVEVSSAPAGPGEGGIRLYEPSVKGTRPALAWDPDSNTLTEVEPSWESFLAWISATLCSPEPSISRHREKLAKSGCDECHLFLGVTDATPDAYFSLLQRGVPSDAPTLPAEIGHLWVMDCRADRCLVWGPQTGWLDPSTVWKEPPEEREDRPDVSKVKVA